MRKSYITVGSHGVPVQNYTSRREQIAKRLTEIADAAEAREGKEKNHLTKAEEDEVDELKREADVIDLKIAAAVDGMVQVSSREAAFDAYLREVVKGRQLKETSLKREYIHQTTSTNADAMVPLTVEDIVEPLEEGLIMGAVGCKLYTGLAGSYVFPVIDAVEAEVAGENVALTDAQIDITKIQPSPKRVGITIRITSQLINQTEGVAWGMIQQQAPEAIIRTLNKCMFLTDTTSSLTLKGALFTCAGATAVAISTLRTKAAKKAATHIAFAGTLPTYAELLAMKGIVLAKGVKGQHMGYVMDEYTKAELEATPRDTGSGRMIVEDGKVAGIPVFCTNYINTDSGVAHVGFGCWDHQLCQQFGDFRLIVDPYTGATKDEVRLTINSDWAMTATRAEAFILGSCASE